MEKISKKTALIWVFIVAAVVCAWRFVWQPAQQKEEPTPLPSNSPVQTSAPLNEEGSPSVKKSSVRTSYKNPGGTDEVAFSLVVDETGTIITASTEVLAKNPTSIQRQEAFAEGLPQAIQGKKISDLTAIDKVGGSSLTTAAFNTSLAELKNGL